MTIALRGQARCLSVGAKLTTQRKKNMLPNKREPAYRYQHRTIYRCRWRYGFIRTAQSSDLEYGSGGRILAHQIPGINRRPNSRPFKFWKVEGVSIFKEARNHIRIKGFKQRVPPFLIRMYFADPGRFQYPLWVFKFAGGNTGNFPPKSARFVPGGTGVLKTGFSWKECGTWRIGFFQESTSICTGYVNVPWYLRLEETHQPFLIFKYLRCNSGGLPVKSRSA